MIASKPYNYNSMIYDEHTSSIQLSIFMQIRNIKATCKSPTFYASSLRYTGATYGECRTPKLKAGAW